MLSMLVTTTGFAATTPYPFPQDCSNVNATTGAPGWFKDCTKASGGCFKIAVPKEQYYNIGNTTFGASKAGGTQWCIDHLQGFVYSKVIDPVGAMYYEVDDRSGTGTAPQCRFLTGYDGEDTKKDPVYRARAYNPAGLECLLTDHNTSKDGIHSYALAVKRTTPPTLTWTRGMSLSLLERYPGATVVASNTAAAAAHVAAGACSADDQTAISAKGGGTTAGSFPYITSDCSKQALSIFSGIDETKFNTCLTGAVSGVSSGCSDCFYKAADYGYKNCKSACLFSWCSEGCLDCAKGFDTTGCAGFTAPAPTPC